MDGIKYQKLGRARGAWFKTGIEINDEFCENLEVTILELVHEASHARFAQTNPLKDRSAEAIIKNEIDSELYAQVNQLDVYKWLKEQNPSFVDPQMEIRLKLIEEGKLIAVIEDIVREERASIQEHPSAPGGQTRPKIPPPIKKLHKKPYKKSPRYIYVEPPR